MNSNNDFFLYFFGNQKVYEQIFFYLKFISWGQFGYLPIPVI